MRRPTLPRRVARGRPVLLALTAVLLGACAGAPEEVGKPAAPAGAPAMTPSRALERDLGPGSASYQRALALMDEEQVEEAQAEFRAAIAEEPSDPRPYVNLGTLHLRARDWSSARGMSELGLQHQPDDWKLLLNHGVSLQQLGQPVKAQEQLEHSLRVGGDDARTWYWLGVAHYSQAFVVLGASSIDHQRLSRAIDALEKAIERDPDEASYHRQLGLALKDKHELERSAASLRRSLELAPDNVETWTVLGTVQSRRGEDAAARQALERALELDSGRAEARLQLGMLRARAGEDEAAVAELERGIELDRSVPDAWYQLSLALRRLGRRDEAKVAMETFEETKTLRDDLRERLRTLLANPGDAVAQYNVGVAQVALGQTSDARRSYERALALDEELAAAHENLAEIFLSEGELDQAREHLERAIELEPEDPSAKVNLGRLEMAAGRPGRALEPLAIAATLQPDHAMPHVLAGLAHLQLGSMTDARFSFERAVEADPEDLVARYNLGGAYFELGELDLADEQFHELLARDPTHAGALAARAGLAQRRAQP